MSQGPCPQKCPGRSATCHSTCKTYLEAFAENLKRYEAKKSDFAIRGVMGVGMKKRMQMIHMKQKEL